ncbi:MAG: multifunctional CCA addition/repair protein [Burkholderiaceae bacterium]|nr:multifunctional CCA addition/repair protein [Burkholderiaceae bacterium]
MQTYVVGGAVRDELLGLPVQDHDHVVVGATPEDMVRQGYRPVGKDFPVFLHPHTHEEYALARTERKTAPGYKGFVFHTSPDVTLEQDLVRRDLTVNAIAKAADGALIDPFNGRADLAARVFRHVSAAFAEDPVRILRVARFAARYGDFKVAPETNALMRQMVEHGEADALVAERVWQEVSRGLMEAAPSRMFDVLRDCGALARILPECDAGPRAMQVIDAAARCGLDLPVRFAALLRGLGGSAPALQALDQLCKRLRVPAECRDLAVMVAREQDCVDGALALDPGAIVKLLERCDGFRKPARFSQLLLASQACADGPYPPRAHLEAALAAARAVNAGDIAQACADQPQQIPTKVHQARVAAVREALA